MTDIFTKVQPLLQTDHEIKWKETAFRLAAAVILGIIIALMHAIFRRRDTRRPDGFGTTLILLTVLVAFVIYVIGNNTARAFGLVGALSIIRFRTSVSDTRDTAFVIFAVAIGMALGAGLFVESMMALPAIAVVCLSMMSLGPVVGPGGRLKLRVTTPQDAENALKDANGIVRWYKMQTGSTGKKDGGVEVVYRVSLKPGGNPSALIDRLRQRPGVLRVSWASNRHLRAKPVQSSGFVIRFGAGVSVPSQFRSRPSTALALLLAINLFNYLDRYILSAVLPEVKREFSCSEAQAGMSASIFLLSYMIVAPIFGWLGDRMSRWMLAGIGVIFWSLASGGTGLAPTFAMLLVTRALIGVGEGAYGPVAPTIIADLYPVEKRGSKLAWFYVAIPVGSALGVAVGGAIASQFGWRWAFYAVVPPGIVLGLLCFMMKEQPRSHVGGKKRPASWNDYAGLGRIPSYVCCTLGMTALTFALGGTAIWLPTYYYERELMFEIKPATITKLKDSVPANIIDKLRPLHDQSFRGEATFREALAKKLSSEQLLEHRSAIVSASHEPNPDKLAHINLLFGAILCSAGLGATLAGGWLGDKLRPRFPGSYFLVSGGGMLIGFPAFVAAVAMPLPWAWPCAFVAVFFLMFNTGPANTILANVTSPAIRSTAFGLNILIIHILGDVPSPMIVGWIHDHYGLRYGMFLLTGATLVSGLIWLWGTRYLERDTKNVNDPPIDTVDAFAMPVDHVVPPG